MASRYAEYAQRGTKGYEIEHIWADHPERHADEFAHPSEFQEYRNRIGGLLLLPKSFNASYGDLPYAEKREHYVGQNLLARSLHEQAYDHNPGLPAVHRGERPAVPRARRVQEGGPRRAAGALPAARRADLEPGAAGAGGGVVSGAKHADRTEALRRFKPYPAYKDSGVEWLGEIPEDWEVGGSRRSLSCSSATIDKKSLERWQEPCASATTRMSDTTRLRATRLHGGDGTRTDTASSARTGDVLVTKDSESWTDIACRGCCGGSGGSAVRIHLAHIRPKRDCRGRFWQGPSVRLALRDQFQVAATASRVSASAAT